MSNIDWASCPEATHFDPVDQNFLREIDRALLLFNRNNGWYVPVHTQYGTTIEDCNRPLLKRPEWTGEGLPPVGTSCEFAAYHGGDPVWKECKVIAHDDGFAVISYKGNYSGQSNNHLRPIRTAEQIAADERKAEIAALEDLIVNHWESLNVHDLAVTIYDAKYRKQEQS